MKQKITLYLILSIIVVSCKNDYNVNLSEIKELQKTDINLKHKLNINDSIFLIPIRVIDTTILEKYKVIAFEEKSILIDSLDAYTKKLSSLLSSILSSQSDIQELKKELTEKNNLALIPIFRNQLKWVNKETFRNHEIENKDFELILDENDSYLISYIIYDDLGRYFSRYLYEDLILKNIPIRKSTSLVIIAITEDDTFYDKIEISKQTEKKLKINLKKFIFPEVHKIFEQ